MKPFNRIILLWVAFLFSGASAQQERGDVELSISGFYYTSVGSNAGFSSGTINGKLGVFLSDHFQIGAFPSLTISRIKNVNFFGDEKSNTSTTFGSGFFATLSFLADAATIPYLGGQYYIQNFDEAKNTASAGVNGGAKFFLNEKAFFDFSANYLFPLSEFSEGGFLLISAGFGFLF